MIKRCCLFTLILLCLVSLPACTSGAASVPGVSAPPIPQEEFVLLPTSGYVCGTEREQTFLQIFLIAGSFDETTIKNLRLECADGTVINCPDYSVGDGGRDLGDNRLYLFRFHIEFPAAGEYTVDKMVLTFWYPREGADGVLHYEGEGTEVAREINDLIIQSAKAEDAITPDGPVGMIEFQVNQADHALYRVTLNNQTGKTAVVKSISFPQQLFAKIESIASYEGLDLLVPRDGLEVPPMSECAFAFRLQPTDAHAFAAMENSVFLFLPYLTYGMDGEAITIISQYQATVMEPDMTPAYLEQLATA